MIYLIFFTQYRYIASMQNKTHMLMIIFGLAVALIYMMGWHKTSDKCGQEGLAGLTEKPTAPGCYLKTNDCTRVPGGPNDTLDANNWFAGKKNDSETDTESKCREKTAKTIGDAGCSNLSNDHYLFIPNPSSTPPGRETTTPDSGLDNYSHFSKNSIPTVYYGPDSSTARVTVAGGENDETGADKKYGITVTTASGATTTYVMETDSDATAVVNPLTSTPETTTTSTQATTVPDSIANTRFIDKSGNVARLFVAKNGQYVVQTRQLNGYDMIYTSTNVFTYDRNNSKSFLVGDSINNITPIGEEKSTTNDLIGSLTNNTISSQQTQTINGIPGRSIPIGQEDLYILKSQIVPPVCPACPQVCASKSSKETCGPCPSCARCDTSTDFTCKKVPDYSSNTAGSTSGGDSMWGPNSNISSSNGANGSVSNYNKYRNNTKFSPVPVVSNFSTFGM
jgi:hypothetical protein